MMLDFTDVDPDIFNTGIEVSMRFRIKQIDNQRGFRKYSGRPSKCLKINNKGEVCNGQWN